ncbi:MAG: hypothetical protein EA397_11830, partial [Deltaproteobacteria bacterium]
MSILTLLALLPAFASAPEPPPCDYDVFGGDDLEWALSSAFPGATICLWPNLYRPSSPSFQIFIDVHLVGLGDSPESVVIEPRPFGSPTSSAVTVEGVNASFFNLTLAGSNLGRAIRVDGGATTLVDVTVQGASLPDLGHDYGGALRAMDGSDVYIYRSSFRDNYIPDSPGGHIRHSGFGGVLHIEDSEFVNGVGRNGGAISTGSYTTLYIEGSHFIGNQAIASANPLGSDGGGALRLFRTDATIVGSRFEDNQSHASGGAIMAGDRGSLSLSQSDFERNEAEGYGGHVAIIFEGDLWGERLRMRDGVSRAGGAIACHRTENCDIAHSGFWNNTALDGEKEGGGGAIWMFQNQARGVQHRNLFCRNHADSDRPRYGGGAVASSRGDGLSSAYNVYVDNTSGSTGGALHNYRSDVALSQYETFIGNRAETAGCSAYFEDSNLVDFSRNLYTQSTCSLSVPPSPTGQDFVLRSQWGEAWASESLFFENPHVLGPFNSQFNWYGLPPLTDDPELPRIDIPLAIDEDCREIYDYVPSPDEFLYDREIGATSPGGEFIDDDGDGVSWLFDCDDQDDGVGVPSFYYPDVDGDGFGDAHADPEGPGCPPPGFVTNNLDCDDKNPDINPDAEEQCDDIDWNCSGDPYDGLEQLPWYLDADGDTWGDDHTDPVFSCEAPSGENWTSRGGDCDDNDEFINPDATEVPYDRIDQNCDGFDQVDLDDDTYPGILWSDWEALDVGTSPAGAWPEGVLHEPVDCNDSDHTINPGAEETPYDRIDQDCSGFDLVDVDEDGWAGISKADWLDQPGGDPALGWPSDLMGEEVDCDDEDKTIYPDAPEVLYDRIDQDCDGFDLVDFDEDTYPGILFSEWEAQPVHPTSPGAWPPSVLLEPLDCDDLNASINPSAGEIPYDRIDQNCDGFDLVDVDGDTFPGILQAEWEALPDGDPDLFWPSGLDERLDCDDDDATIFPDAPEVPYDRIDQSCDTFDLVDVDGDTFPGILKAEWEDKPVHPVSPGAWPPELKEALDCNDED